VTKRKILKASRPPLLAFVVPHVSEARIDAQRWGVYSCSVAALFGGLYVVPDDQRLPQSFFVTLEVTAHLCQSVVKLQA
jgi:hypothetical protein